ncbi:SDR family NAD(P)-dependent oxidoreductase [Paractinoplanes atraurantiacus]|uniref:NADP-dependent 3-hydroxy acid dehydrogenase YdfG n=1 Tax=Paractinoplanes atraurantiacus TaxID=1036182 RepID=A0A285KTP1_9ACTN|nr:SDR family NAD(P)-dependent oxidoreductase [Actinoplanes atraurantiacus]SNY76014.1 NADP-dependent 3-hydroxy acid dehydrogenase YdfG [Actinoplanes atraurantiacus]
MNWFVTGSSRGLGRAIVEEALAAGHRVAATARSVDSFGELAAAYGDKLLPLVLDVTDAAQAQTAVDAAIAAFGHLDVVVNNAGYANLVPIEDITLDDFRAQMDAVFYGTVYVTKAALPHFVERRAGHFIQVTSVGGRGTAPGVGAYQSGKWAVEGFSGVLAKETGPLGVKVTLAEPGAMRTDWSGSSMEIPPVSANYAGTVGAMGEFLRQRGGQEPIDPVKVARVLLDVAAMEQPPLHLPLGRDAVDIVRGEMAILNAEDARWAELGRSVDFD